MVSVRSCPVLQGFADNDELLADPAIAAKFEQWLVAALEQMR